MPSPLYRHVYAHFPFCDVICHYCDFYTARSKEARHDEFFTALKAEANEALPQLDQRLEALYLGGGTPSASPPELLEEFLALFRERIGPETEVTLEANPTNVTPASLEAWRKMGINRLSLGVQSLNDEVLKRLGRVHSGRQALDAISLAREYFENVSGDLIYGVPGQEEEEPAEHGEAFAITGATHISAYHLTITPQHFLYPKLPEDSFAWRQIERLAARLEGQGFSHYEVSNFALPGFASKNNSNYWSGGPYWALGPSAHGFNGKDSRWKNVANWEEYVHRLLEGMSPIEEKETLSRAQRRIEALFTGLRTSAGIDLERFQADFGEDLTQSKSTLLQSLKKEGLLTLANGRIALTFAGRMLADEIVRKLL